MTKKQAADPSKELPKLAPPESVPALPNTNDKLPEVAKLPAAVEKWIDGRAIRGNCRINAATKKFKPGVVYMANWQPKGFTDFHVGLSTAFPKDPIPLDECLALHQRRLEFHARRLGCWNQEDSGKDYLSRWRPIAPIDAWIASRSQSTAKATAEGKYKPNAVCMADWRLNGFLHFQEELHRRFPNTQLDIFWCLASHQSWLKHYAQKYGCWSKTFEERDYSRAWQEAQEVVREAALLPSPIRWLDPTGPTFPRLQKQMRPTPAVPLATRFSPHLRNQSTSAVTTGKMERMCNHITGRLPAAKVA